MPFGAQPQLDRVFIDRKIKPTWRLSVSLAWRSLDSARSGWPDIAVLSQRAGLVRVGKGMDACGWETLRFSKAAFAVEGQPTGWHQIDGIRIAVWRESSVDFQSFPIAASRCAQRGTRDSDSRRSERCATALQTAEEVGDMLAELGLGSDAIEDEAIAGGALGDRSVAILAYNPGLSDAALDALVQFVERGGKF